MRRAGSPHALQHTGASEAWNKLTQRLITRAEQRNIRRLRRCAVDAGEADYENTVNAGPARVSCGMFMPRKSLVTGCAREERVPTIALRTWLARRARQTRLRNRSAKDSPINRRGTGGGQNLPWVATEWLQAAAVMHIVLFADVDRLFQCLSYKALIGDTGAGCSGLNGDEQLPGYPHVDSSLLWSEFKSSAPHGTQVVGSQIAIAHESGRLRVSLDDGQFL